MSRLIPHPRHLTLSLFLSLPLILLLLTACQSGDPTPTAIAIPEGALDQPDTGTLAEDPMPAALGQLALSLTELDPIIELRPGDVYTFTLGTVECCYALEPVAATPIWSVTPAAGASLIAGRLAIAADVAPGTIYTVNATVETEAGPDSAAIDVYIYTPESQPLVGLWTESAQLTCTDGAAVVPNLTIGEVRFRGDGTFNVTWVPFEIYVDYWGTYEFNPASGAVNLTVVGGNYIPDDLDLSGTFSRSADDELTLDSIWLGRASSTQTAANGCGHILIPG